MPSFKEECFKSLILLIFSASLAACSVRLDDPATRARPINLTSCHLPKDQGRGSFKGNWASLPITLVFDKDFYLTDGGEAMPSIRNAVNTWNSWAGVKGRQAFVIKNDGSGVSAGQDIPELTGCDQLTYSSVVTDAVGIWKISTYGFHSNRRASCDPLPSGEQGKILPDGVQGQTEWVIQAGRITSASILLNFDGFNSPGTRKIDLESLLLHELGHVLGLLHSCNGSGGGGTDNTTAPACDFAPETYKSAVMHPFLYEGQIRRDLRANDYNRINCIY